MAGAIWYVWLRGDDEFAPVETQLKAEIQPVVEGLNIPWQMRWLAPHHILFTELAGSVKRLNLSNGTVKTLGTIPDLAREIQAGLMGFDLHPKFDKNPYIFLCYNYYADDQIYLAVDRYRYLNDTILLDSTIVDQIPSFAISIGGRILVESNYLYLTVGEGAASELAQDPDSWSGKILRYHLDGSIPIDNPQSNSPVWASGFRNPQGLTSTSVGLFATEHGTFSNDEINKITKGGNYGWPLYSGSCFGSECDQNYEYALESWTPTVAPSGLDYYSSDRYAFLKDHLLTACLKGQRIKATAVHNRLPEMQSFNLAVNRVGRIRDVLVNPEGRIFAASSNSDVYGTPRAGGDGIYEIIPQDTLVAIRKKNLEPPPLITLDSTHLEVKVVASKLRLPWDLNWVAPEKIWFNERGGAIKQLDLQTGKISLVHQIDDVYESVDNSGMHGFTVHPSYPDQPFVYGHYTYELYKSKIVRYTIDTLTLKVIDEKILIPDLEGNKSHNGSRLVFGPDGKLYFCIGDGYKRRAAQKVNRFNGKILRLNEDGSIPEDNPLPDSYIFSIGHRNPQGLAWGENGILYASEHGSSNDDEINVIVAGGNYGFPNVQGLCNERSEKRFCERYQVHEPIHHWTPTVGPAGIDYFGHTSIPEWKNSILVTTLKSGDGAEGQRLLQMGLSTDGTTVEEVNSFLTFSFGRLRDVMVAPDGRIFICTSNQETNQNASDIVQEVDDRIIQLRVVANAMEIL